MKFALIRERKSPPDRRVVFSPQALKELKKRYPQSDIVIEPSSLRIFPDESYEAEGFCVDSDISSADVLLGVKEVPIENLIPNKKYFFFSHTIKKQSYNRELLKAILNKNITLYDHETITDVNNRRLIGFGYYAGIVGAYNGIRAWGLKTKKFKLPFAATLANTEELLEKLNAITLDDIKIVLTGTGRVGSGAKEVLSLMGIKEVSVEEFLGHTFNRPVYVQLAPMDYIKRKDGRKLGTKNFFEFPEEYDSDFTRYTRVSDLFIAGHFYADGAPLFITQEIAKSKDFKIKVIADISCDIGIPIASTLRASTINDPIYGYDPATGKETDYTSPDAIAVMAVDNLPCELPENASRGFGFQFLNHVIPAFYNNDMDGILERAKICEAGKLTPRFAYLQDYVEGKE